MAKVFLEKELAEHYGVKPHTVRTWRLRGGCPHFRTAGKVFYRLEVVEHWMAEQEAASVEQE